MPRNKVSAGGHEITIESSLWSGRERVTCDGQVVSSKTSYFYLTPHSFRLDEGGQSVTYEVDVLVGWMGSSTGTSCGATA